MPITLFNTIPFMDVDTGGNVYIASPNEYAIRRYSESGRLLSVFSVDVDPAPMTKEAIAAAIGTRRKPIKGGPPQFEREANLAANRQLDEAIPNAPATLPVLDRMKVLSDGSIWVRRYTAPNADSARWDAFTADGKPIGSVVQDTNNQLRGGNSRHVLLMSKDSLDYPILHWYALKR